MYLCMGVCVYVCAYVCMCEFAWVSFPAFDCPIGARDVAAFERHSIRLKATGEQKAERCALDGLGAWMRLGEAILEIPGEIIWCEVEDNLLVIHVRLNIYPILVWENRLLH